MAGPGTTGGLLSRLSGLFAGGSGGVSPIGMSIGTSSVKIVELKKSGKGWKFHHFGLRTLPEDAIVNREIVNHLAVVEGARELVDQMKLKGKALCTSFSGTSVIIKRMTVQVQNARELQEAVFWEAEQYLPFDVNDVVMDFHTIQKGKDGGTDVLLVAAKRSVLDSYMSCATDAGVKPKIVDVDYFALQNVFEANYPANPAEAVCLIDIGAGATKVMVVQGGVPLFTKDSAYGGKNLTAEIQKHLNISYQDAESLKSGGTAAGLPQEVSDIMRNAGENIATEIKRTVDFYDASASGPPIAYLLITGGGAKIPELSRMIEDQVKRPTQILNPFNAVSYDPNAYNQDFIANVGPLAAIPMGLAIRAGMK